MTAYTVEELMLLYCQFAPFLNFMIFFCFRSAGRLKVYMFNYASNMLTTYKVYVIMNLIFMCVVGIFFLVGGVLEGHIFSVYLFSLQGLHLRLSFDTLSMCMFVLVSCVSCIVHVYSLWYMSGDININRFLAYLSFFTGSMLVLVLGDNYLQMFIGWEFVGVSSFLLIGFWDQRREAIRAACKALFLNKIGDFFFMLGVVVLYRGCSALTVSSLDYDFLLLSEADLSTWYLIDVVGFCLFIAATAKSAQLGLHMWLIDAMEGPTPVSALIHAATMVTAGIFLLLRSHFILVNCSLWLIELISIWGILSAFVGGFLAMFQFDIKKIIAYSTMSQLGYMLSVVCLDPLLSLYHLINHGWFKALLFLAAGVVIHACNNEQDIRGFKSMLWRRLPLTFSMFIFCSCAMIALPLTSGFFSKDIIYEVLYSTKYLIYFYNLLYVVSFFTITYSVRLIYYVFFRPTVFPVNCSTVIIEEPRIVTLYVYSVLVFMTLFSGYVYNYLFVNLKFMVVLNFAPISICYALLLVYYFVFFSQNNWTTGTTVNVWLKALSFLTNRGGADILFNVYFYKNFLLFCWLVYFYIEMGWAQLVGPMCLTSYRFFGRVGASLELYDSFKVAIIGYIVCLFIFVVY